VSRRILAALGSLLFGASLAASAAASDLSWSGPRDCAQSEQLVFQVERALGAPLVDTGDVHLQVHVTRTVPTVRALLRIEDDAAEPALSERSLVAPDCEKLVDTLAVAITLAIEAAAPPPPDTVAVGASLQQAAAPAPVTVVAPVPASPPADVAAAEPARGAEPGPTPRVVARLLGDVGSLPSPAIGLGLGARLGWPRLRLELLGALWSEQHVQLGPSAAPNAGADVSLVTGALSVCSTPLGADADALVFGLCLEWEMGRLAGVGTGISSPRQANELWLAGGANAGLTWRPAPPLGIGAHIGAAAPLGRSTFYIERLGTVHRAASVVARVGLSIDVAFE
jgi:hypothetical protein